MECILKEVSDSHLILLMYIFLTNTGSQNVHTT